jgi:hypothetical protein
VVSLSLCWQRPTGLIIEDGGGLPHRHYAAAVVAVSCRSPGHGITRCHAARHGSPHNVRLWGY